MLPKSLTLVVCCGLAIAGLLPSPAAAAQTSTKNRSPKALAEALRANDVHARWRAARDLRKLGKSAAPAIPDLIEALDDSDADVAGMAAEALAAAGPESPDVLTALTDALQKPDWEVRWSAAAALRRLGAHAKSAEKALRTVANSDKDPDVREEARRALVKLSGPVKRIRAR